MAQKVVQFNEAMRQAFKKRLASSRFMFLLFTGVTLIILVIGVLHLFDAFAVKNKSPEFGAILDFIFFTTAMISAFLAFVKYSRIRCPGCLNSIPTLTNPKFCPKCFQNFVEIDPGATPTATS